MFVPSSFFCSCLLTQRDLQWPPFMAISVARLSMYPSDPEDTPELPYHGKISIWIRGWKGLSSAEWHAIKTGIDTDIILIR